MSHYDSTTKIKICWSLYRNGVSLEDIPEQLGIHRATVYRWIKGIKLKGINKFIRDYKNAKKGRRRPNKTNPIIKLHIYQIRKENHNCCGEKIKYFLRKQYREEVSVSTIFSPYGDDFSKTPERHNNRCEITAILPPFFIWPNIPISLSVLSVKSPSNVI